MSETTKTDLVIEVSGNQMTGKSTAVALINKLLDDAGIPSIAVSEDGDADAIRMATLSTDDLIARLKSFKRTILVKEKTNQASTE